MSYDSKLRSQLFLNMWTHLKNDQWKVLLSGMLTTKRIVNLPSDQVYESQYLPVQVNLLSVKKGHRFLNVGSITDINDSIRWFRHVRNIHRRNWNVSSPISGYLIGIYSISDCIRHLSCIFHVRNWMCFVSVTYRKISNFSDGLMAST